MKKYYNTTSNVEELATVLERELGEMDIACREEAELPTCLSRVTILTSSTHDADRTPGGITTDSHEERTWTDGYSLS